MWNYVFILFRYKHIQSGPNKGSFSDQMLAASVAGTKNSLFIYFFLSNFLLGVLTTVATNPIWVIKNRLQIQSSIIQNKQNYKNSLGMYYID